MWLTLELALIICTSNNTVAGKIVLRWSVFCWFGLIVRQIFCRMIKHSFDDFALRIYLSHFDHGTVVLSAVPTDLISNRDANRQYQRCD